MKLGIRAVGFISHKTKCLELPDGVIMIKMHGPEIKFCCICFQDSAVLSHVKHHVKHVIFVSDVKVLAFLVNDLSNIDFSVNFFMLFWSGAGFDFTLIFEFVDAFL